MAYKEQERRYWYEKLSTNNDLFPFVYALSVSSDLYTNIQVKSLEDTLQSPPYNLPCVTLSLDDIYITRAEQKKLALKYPKNPLLQHRGQPLTHDLALAENVLTSLKQNAMTAIPQYDKSAFSGEGDRVSENRWKIVNNDERKIMVVIFEGWCVGFRALNERELKEKWYAAVERKNQGAYDGRLGYVRWDDIRTINQALESYEIFTRYVPGLSPFAIFFEYSRRKD
jgi:D-glycerate 3-kinase